MKAMNFLLPHIKRLPQLQARIQFARDASHGLQIDSAVTREEFDRAARNRLDSIGSQIARDISNLSQDLPQGFSRGILQQVLHEAQSHRKGGITIRSSALTEVERVLLRALAIDDPEFERSRRLASDALAAQPAWFEHLAAFAALQALSARQALDPMDVVENEAQRALLAETLLAETKPPEESEVQSAIQEIHERAIESRQRELRTLIAEAERRGDHAELALLTQQKLDLDRALRQLHNQKPPER